MPLSVVKITHTFPKPLLTAYFIFASLFPFIAFFGTGKRDKKQGER